MCEKHSEKEINFVTSFMNGYRLCISSGCVSRYINYCYSHAHYDDSQTKLKKLGYESHHVIPKSILNNIGKNLTYKKFTKNNIVRYNKKRKLIDLLLHGYANRVMLTEQEHIRAHILLNEALRKEYKERVNYSRNIYTKRRV